MTIDKIIDEEYEKCVQEVKEMSDETRDTLGCFKEALKEELKAFLIQVLIVAIIETFK